MFNENLVIRMGGLGDLTILSSSLQALKNREPWRPLVLATVPHNMDLLTGAPFLDRVISIDNFEKEKWFKIYDLRWGVEPTEIGPGKLSWEHYIGRDRSDNFDDLLGVKNGHKQFFIPVDSVNSETVRLVKQVLKEKGHGLLIGLSPTSRSPIRCYPPDYVEPLVQLILKEIGNTVILFGKTEGWCEYLAHLSIPGVFNLIDNLSVKELVAVISMLDLVISPDTAVYHIAAALQRPCLALFGNIEPHTRVTYYPTVTALYPEGELPCIPCWDVPHVCHRVPDEFGGKCMRLFTPERVVEGLRSLT